MTPKMTAKSEQMAGCATRTVLLRTMLVSTLLVVLSGCQSAPSDLSPDQAEQLQTRVLSITTAVADGSYSGALDEVAALEADLDAAAAAGTVSFSRYQRIEAALATVRADVQAAIDAQVAPAPTETATPVAPVDDGDGDDDDDEKKAPKPPAKDKGKDKGKDKREKPSKPKG
ncbi:MAG: hypothetical protein ABWX82_06585 [Leifsonia sp.]